MKTTMAGPGGIRHPDEVVDLSKAEASALIKAGAAVPVPSADTPDEGGAMSDKDPFTDEKGRFGIDLDDFLKWYDPEDYREARENHKPIFFLGDPWDAKDERRAAANRRLRERLSEALKSTYELRYLSLDNPDADWELVKPHRYPEIVKQVSYGLSGIRKTFKLEGCDRPVPVRVFRRRHRKEGPRSAGTWAVERLKEIESEYQAKIAAGKAPRKPLIEELMEQLINENPNLSKTTFRHAWKDAQGRDLIPGIGKVGAPKGPRRPKC